jgi:hypothetical protein
MPEFMFIVDELMGQLKEGHTADVHGLVVPCAWRWADNNPEAAKSYEALASSMVAVGRGSFYVYKPSELHCTLATLSRCAEHTHSIPLRTMSHLSYASVASSILTRLYKLAPQK